MLSKCANPSCPQSFHYLHSARLYRLETGPGRPASGRDAKPSRKLEYFWLCADCSERLTLAYENGRGVIAVPLAPTRAAAA